MARAGFSKRLLILDVWDGSYLSELRRDFFWLASE
jgi:hypothetical protein